MESRALDSRPDRIIDDASIQNFSGGFGSRQSEVHPDASRGVAGLSEKLYSRYQADSADALREIDAFRAWRRPARTNALGAALGSNDGSHPDARLETDTPGTHDRINHAERNTALFRV